MEPGRHISIDIVRGSEKNHSSIFVYMRAKEKNVELAEKMLFHHVRNNGNSV
jgi:hypothetical protein